MDTEYFPQQMALAAIDWPNAKRVLQHRNRGQAFAFADEQGFAGSEVGAPSDHIGPRGWGAGAVVHFSTEAIVQTAIALRLIDSGVKVPDAYNAGAHFVFLGDVRSAAAATWGVDEPSAFDPVLDRPPGRLFHTGETWLVYASGPVEYEPQFLYISSADPRIACVDGRPNLQQLRYFFYEKNDVVPVILLDISSLCHRISVSLGIDAFRTWGWGTK